MGDTVILPGKVGETEGQLRGRGRSIDSQVDAATAGGSAQAAKPAVAAAPSIQMVQPKADTTDYAGMSDADIQAQLDAIGSPKSMADATRRINLRTEQQRRSSAAQRAAPPPAEQAPPPAKDPQASTFGRDYRNVYRAPNGVVHDIYGPDTAAQGVAFHGGPGIPISGANHPAFIGQSIAPEQGLVEYRIPQRDTGLQERLLAQRPA